MQTSSCPTCGKPLSETTGFCPRCGTIVPLAGATVRLPLSQRAQSRRQSALADQETLPLEPNEAEITVRLPKDERTGSQSLQESFDEEEELPEQHATWQKVVNVTPHGLPALTPQELAQKHAGRFFLPKQQMAPRPIFWLGLIVLFALIFSSAFITVIRLKQLTPPTPSQPVLQVSPATVALGGIITLRGAHFIPHSILILSRDQQLQVIDTGGVSSIQVDSQGIFSDTVIIDPNWLAGKHTLYATNTQTHKQAAFSLFVTGQNALQGPPHLLLSANSLDFGAGDEATNATKLLAISNAGGGQLLWQASSEPSWLQISPTSGSIASGVHMSVIVAIDRSKLSPADYMTNILFTSNTEQATILVNMSVIPLQPEHQAALQLSPAVLTFAATANGPNPPAQTIIVSNPGVQPLMWDMTMTFQNNLGRWLLASSQAGNVAPGDQQQLSISVQAQGLAPGVYKGMLTFANHGPKPIQGSPQSIFVSLIVAPACTLALTPTTLSFTGMHEQASPAAQPLQVGVAPGCPTSQQWNVTSTTVNGGNWLSISQSSGSTPTQPLVSVNTAGLPPGRYTGTLTFAAHANQQLVSVTLTVTPLPCLLAAPSTLSMQGTAGQATPSTQNVTLSSSGDCPHALEWTSLVTVTTPNGGTWLNATPTGSFTPPANANLTVQATLTGLTAGTYTGTLSLSAVDSVTNQSIGIIQVAITLTVLPPCTLQTPSATSLTFNANVGNNPTPNTASFTVNVVGNCAGMITTTPSVDAAGSSWLTTTSPAAIASGGTATFTVTVTSTALTAGTYTSTITLSAVDGNGAIAGSPQTVQVTLTVT